MLKRLYCLEEYIAGALVFVIVGSISLQVFCRYLLNSPLSWPEEVAKLAFVWAIFLGATLGVKRRAHISVDALVDLFPIRVRLATRVLVYAMVIGILVILAAKGIDMVRMASTSVLPAINIRVSYLYLPVPVCSVLMILDFFRLLQHAVICFRKGIPEQATEQVVG